MLQGRISQAPAGLIGFDTTDRLNPATAKQYFNKGYRYCVRYLSHNKNAKSQYNDLTADEAQIILDSGMALFVVQHPLRSGWVPTGKLGQTFDIMQRRSLIAFVLPSRFHYRIFGIATV
jgi:Domain of unknown function (DUF1906)